MVSTGQSCRSTPLLVAPLTVAVATVATLSRATRYALVMLACPTITPSQRPLAKIPTSIVVQPVMIFRRHKHQILWTVVMLDAVDVMNVLVRAKRTADLLLHHEAMLSYMAAPRNMDGNIASWVTTAATLPDRAIRAASLPGHANTSACVRAVHDIAASEPRRGDGERRSTDLANAFDGDTLSGHSGLLSRVWGAMPRAVSAAPRLLLAPILLQKGSI